MFMVNNVQIEEVKAMSDHFLGIDVAKATFDVALDMNTGVHMAHFKNNEAGFRRLARWLDMQNAGQLHACMEATGRYWEALADWLYGCGYRVSVVNPARTRAYAMSKLLRNKTDKVDARNIANFCRTQVPEQWCSPAVEQRQLRDMVRRYSALQKMQKMERNRFQSGVIEPFVVADLTAHLDYLKACIGQLWRAIKALIAMHPWLTRQHALLVTIPGIGDLTAARLLGEIPNIAAFNTAKDLAAYAGVTPRHFTSGSSIQRYTPITKTGSSHLRSLLYWPAISASQHNPAVQALCERLLERGKSKMAAIGAAMRKLLHIIFGVIKSDRPFDLQLAMPTTQIS
jgi:transposase